MAETGHAKNVANFATMIAFCTGYGADFAPTNAMISLASLNAALADAQAALDDVQAKIVPWKSRGFRKYLYRRPSANDAFAYGIQGQRCTYEPD